MAYRDQLEQMQARRVTSKGRLFRAAMGAMGGARAMTPAGSVVEQGANFLNGTGGGIRQAEIGRARIGGMGGGITGAGGLSSGAGRLGSAVGNSGPPPRVLGALGGAAAGLALGGGTPSAPRLNQSNRTGGGSMGSAPTSSATAVTERGLVSAPRSAEEADRNRYTAQPLDGYTQQTNPTLETRPVDTPYFTLQTQPAGGGPYSAAGPKQMPGGAPVQGGNANNPASGFATSSQALSTGGVVGGIGGFLTGGPLGAAAGAYAGDQIFGGSDGSDQLKGPQSAGDYYGLGGVPGQASADERTAYNTYLQGEVAAGRGRDAMKFDAWRATWRSPDERYNDMLGRLNAATGEAPQFDQAALDQTLQAGRAQRAMADARNNRALMERAAASGLSPQQVIAMQTGNAQQSSVEGYATNAKARLTAELENFQARKEWASRRRENALMALNGMLSAEERAAAESEALRMAAIEDQYTQAMIRRQQEYEDSISEKDVLGALFGIGGSAASGLASGLASGRIG